MSDIERPRQPVSGRGRRVGGKDHLLETGARQLGSVRFDQLLAGKLSSRGLARVAGVSSGSVNHHFPGGRQQSLDSLPYAVAQRALDHFRIETAGYDGLPGSLDHAIEMLKDDQPDAIDRIAVGLTQDIELVSPDGGPTGTAACEENVLFLLCAAAPTDPLAREMARAFCNPNLQGYRRGIERLLEVTGRTMAPDLTVTELATVTGALSDGLIWQRRYMAEQVPASLMWRAWSRLFTACTLRSSDVLTAERVPEASEPFAAFEAAFPPSGRLGLDQEKGERIREAAMSAFDSGGWEVVTIQKVASIAEVSPNTVRANVGSREGLAALIWGRRHMGDLVAIAEREDLTSMARLRTLLTELAVICQSHADRDMTRAMLDGVFSYSFMNGAPVPGDLADPRAYVPLPVLFMPLLEHDQHRFRDGFADTDAARRESAALLVNQALHLGMVRGDQTRQGAMRPTAIANRVMDTTLRGMLRDPDGIPNSR